MKGLSLWFMADGFNIVAIGSDDEGSVVVWVILLPETRSAVVFPSGSDRCLITGV
jgi:hypothetical protein